MAIALAGEDRLPRGPVRDFVEALHALYDEAGQPAARMISRAIYKRPALESVSHETVSATLRGDSVPAWGRVTSMVTALAGMSVRELDLDEEVRRFHALWIDARRELSPQVAAARPPALEHAAVPRASAPPEPIVRASRVAGPLPERNPDFTGRELILDTLRERHLSSPDVPVVLVGPAGVGKTQLAREYVHRFGDEYQVVWWVPATDLEGARASLVGLAERLGLPLRESADQTVAGLLTALESRRFPFLLVFDDLRAELLPMIPARGGAVLVTSRDATWTAERAAVVRLEVPDFDQAEARMFLRRRAAGLALHEADEVIGRTGTLPLALEQLAALRLTSGRSWPDLLALLDEPAGGGWAGGSPALAASIRLTIDQLLRTNPSAVRILELFPWFGSDPVAVALLRRGGFAEVSPELRRTLRDPIALNRSLTDLSRHGLARWHTTDQRVEVRALTRIAVREALPDEARARTQRDVQVILAAADLGWPDDVVWDLHREIAPHVLPSGLVQSPDPAARRAVLHQIRYSYLLGEHERARRLAETAAAAWPGEDDELSYRIGRERANALRALGRYADAVRLTQDALDRLQSAGRYGWDHPSALVVAGSHAVSLRIQGRFAEAFDLDREVHDRLARSTSPNDSHLAVARHNLAISSRLLGRFADAERIDRRLVEGRRAESGGDDRRTRRYLRGLAEDLVGLGRFQDALDLELPGPERPGSLGFLRAQRTMGIARRRLGQRPRAVELLQSCYTEAAGSLGAEHEFTLAATMSYANALRDSGSVGEAYPVALDAVGGYEHLFGADHPLMLAALVNLAVVLRARGERYQALRTDEVVHERIWRVLGAAHPFTVVAAVNLAIDRAQTGDATAARQLAERAYRLARDTLGPEHVDTLVAAANLRVSGGDTGPEMDEVLAALRRVLGPGHRTVREATEGGYVDCDIEPPSASAV